jgi:hypothetical protein
MAAHFPVENRSPFRAWQVNHARGQERDEMMVKNKGHVHARPSNVNHNALPFGSAACVTVRAASTSGSCTLIRDSNIVMEGSIHTLMSGAFSP